MSSQLIATRLTTALPAAAAPAAGAPSLAARAMAVLGLAATKAPQLQDEREAYLAQSVDHNDLALRQRAWEAHEQARRSLPFTG